MSYDLQFFKKRNSPVSKSDIEKYLAEITHVSQEEEDEWVYQNPNTGVYCVFGFSYFEEEDEDEDEEEGFDDFESTNLSFMINFNRPDFFGKECFPIVDQLVEDLDLYVLDPQGDSEAPKKYEKGYFELEWAQSNLHFSKYFFKETEIGSLARDKSNKCWQFLLNKTEVQNEIGDEYFVPKIFFIQNNSNREVITACVWPHHIPIVLPEVDYIIIQREKKKLFHTKMEEGVVSYSEVMASCGSFFREEKWYKVLDPEASDRVAEVYNKLSLSVQLPQLGELIRNDSFVNIDD